MKKDIQQNSFDFDETDNQFKLIRPLVFFDLETTGLDFEKDRIVQFAFLRLTPNHEKEEWCELVNPGIPIPKEASAVHHITDQMVQDKPLFKEYATPILRYIENCDLAGFNIARFDIPFLQNELTRNGYSLDLSAIKIVDVQTIYHSKEPRDLSAAYRFYCNSDHLDAHDAMGDVRATAEIFDAQIARYNDLPKSVEQIHNKFNRSNDRWITMDRKFYWRDGQATMAFGKHRGKAVQWVAENDRDYLAWISEKDFSIESKTLMQQALAGVFPQKENNNDE